MMPIKSNAAFHANACRPFQCSSHSVVGCIEWTFEHLNIVQLYIYCIWYWFVLFRFGSAVCFLTFIHSMLIYRMIYFAFCFDLLYCWHFNRLPCLPFERLYLVKFYGRHTQMWLHSCREAFFNGDKLKLAALISLRSNFMMWYVILWFSYASAHCKLKSFPLWMWYSLLKFSV